MLFLKLYDLFLASQTLTIWSSVVLLVAVYQALRSIQCHMHYVTVDAGVIYYIGQLGKDQKLMEEYICEMIMWWFIFISIGAALIYPYFFEWTNWDSYYQNNFAITTAEFYPLQSQIFMYLNTALGALSLIFLVCRISNCITCSSKK